MARNFFYHTPLPELHSITSKLINDFYKLNIRTVGDLLWYFPWRYEDLSEIKKISELQENEITTLRVTVEKIKAYRSWQKKIMITELLASDDSGQVSAMWFGQKFVSQVLKIGDEIFLSGKAQIKGKKIFLQNPTYEKVKDRPLHSARLVPNYHLSGKMTQKQLRFIIDKALKIAPSIDDQLPVEILNEEKYPWLFEALEQIHFPGDQKQLARAIERLKFQELLYLQLKYQLAKKDYQKSPSYSINVDQNFTKQFINKLPFELTIDQKKAWQELITDLNKKQAMNRLLEGDVGSGKTIIAFLAALAVAKDGKQVAFMAPTEILAHQHFLNALTIFPKTISKDLALLTKSQQYYSEQESSKDKIINALQNNKIKIIFGTHSLIQDKIKFQDLALVVIDEQHRFGVRQRQALKNKNANQLVPHLLSMTATPIPRTLSLTLYGDLDISLIKSRPAGRKVIKTFLVPEKKRIDAYQFIREKIQAGQQAFVICPLIEENNINDPSEQAKISVKSVKKEYQKLKDEIFPDLDIEFLHGQMSGEEKNRIMTNFKNNKFPILVATSVIEVGVDIPGATMMIIEGAERFGLSQLHQFRGRIGRNALESFCLLFTSDSSQLSTKRLKIFSKENDGFKLAGIDLTLRGSGEIFGTKQSGLMPLKIATLHDAELIKKAQNWAKEIIANKKYHSQTQVKQLLSDLKTEMHLE